MFSLSENNQADVVEALMHNSTSRYLDCLLKIDNYGVPTGAKR